MGEREFEPNVMMAAVQGELTEQAAAVEQEMRLTTPGGRYQVRWDDTGNATALGQLAFFAEFLDVSGLFERWVTACPMAYTSPNAPDTKDVLGTWLLSILDGQWRYAHITGLRGDSVAPGILGMHKIVSDESLRRGLKHLAPDLDHGPETERPAREAQLAQTSIWMDQALMESVREALGTGWILDIDHHQTSLRPSRRRRDQLQPDQARTAYARHSYLLDRQRPPRPRRRSPERQGPCRVPQPAPADRAAEGASRCRTTPVGAR